MNIYLITGAILVGVGLAVHKLASHLLVESIGAGFVSVGVVLISRAT